MSKRVVKKRWRHGVDKVFLPPIDELYERATAVRWLTHDCLFCEELITAIMDNEEISIEFVRKCVARHGATTAEIILIGFIK